MTTAARSLATLAATAVACGVVALPASATTPAPVASPTPTASTQTPSPATTPTSVATPTASPETTKAVAPAPSPTTQATKAATTSTASAAPRPTSDDDARFVPGAHPDPEVGIQWRPTTEGMAFRHPTWKATWVQTFSDPKTNKGLVVVRSDDKVMWTREIPHAPYLTMMDGPNPDAAGNVVIAYGSGSTVNRLTLRPVKGGMKVIDNTTKKAPRKEAATKHPVKHAEGKATAERKTEPAKTAAQQDKREASSDKATATQRGVPAKTGGEDDFPVLPVGLAAIGLVGASALTLRYRH